MRLPGTLGWEDRGIRVDIMYGLWEERSRTYYSGYEEVEEEDADNEDEEEEGEVCAVFSYKLYSQL